MIELPEIAVLANQINDTLAGRRIINATAGYTPHTFAWYTGDPANYGNLLKGKSISLARAYGGYLEIKAEDVLMHITTPLIHHAKGDKLPKKHQLLLEFDDGTAVSSNVQMWGHLFCFKEGDPGDVHSGCIYKDNPVPLTAGFSREYFRNLLDESTRKLSAKAFLATEQRIPGLGNGVLQDILWVARIHPKRKISSLSPVEFDIMYDAVNSVLEQMIEKGGRDTERDLFGKPGGYKTILSKNTADMPCPVCGTYIRKEAYMGGSIYYCGGCQPL